MLQFRYRKLMALLMILSIMVSFMTVSVYRTEVSAATPLPYSENFEDGIANGWSTPSGSWDIITDGTKVYHTLSTDSISRAYVGDSSWNNYSVEVKAKVSAWGSSSARTVGILARYTDTNNYYLMGYEYPGELRIRKKVAGTLTTLTSKAYTLNTGTWYTMKAELNGNSLKLYINGVQQLTITDSTFSSGSAGLISVYGNSRFDDFSVNSLTTTTPTPTPTPHPTYVAKDDFEDGDWDYYLELQKNNPESGKVVTPSFGAANGSKAWKFQWDRKYYVSTDRPTKGTELVVQNRADWNRDVYESFYYYFPSDGFANDSKSQIIKQWIAWHSSIPSCNKTFALSVDEGVLSAFRLWGTDIVNPNQQSYQIHSNIPKDKWIKFTLHLRFDRTGTNGMIKIWMDGNKVLDVSGVEMGVGVAAYGPYAKYGPYVHSSSNYEQRIFYADDIKWGYDYIAP